MLKHFVFLRYSASVPQDHVDEFCERMHAIASQLPEVITLEIGRDILREARSWDLMLAMEFHDVASLRKYQQHPSHLEVMSFNQPYVAEVGSVDFEAKVND